MKKILSVVLTLMPAWAVWGQSYEPLSQDTCINSEWHEDKLWVYKQSENFMVAMACYKQNDDLGKFYQLGIVIQNISDKDILFDPADMSGLMGSIKGICKAKIFTARKLEKKIRRQATWAAVMIGIAGGINAASSAYGTTTSITYLPNGTVCPTTSVNYNPAAANIALTNTNMQIAQMVQQVENSIKITQQGYLKKNTIHPGEGIAGYVNIKWDSCRILTIKLRIEDEEFLFVWNTNKKYYRKKERQRRKELKSNAISSR